ncbi:MAG: sulfatase [Planctomycetota bacterium]|nr:MAG: sulfatase [Planctomycetota bacterium]
MYVDHLIGQLLERLKQTGVLDRCLLIVTADHGISFRKALPKRWLMPGNEDDVLSVPLFVKSPFQTTGEISDRAVESVDLLPTIADVVGLKLQAPTDGWSVFETSHPERKHFTVSEGRRTQQFESQIFKVSETPNILQQRFGKGSDREAMFRIGPRPELVGQSVQSLEQSSEPRVEIETLRYGTEVVDSPNSERPCYFSGTIVSPTSADEPVVLAVAVNGTIHAVTQADQQFGSGSRWSAMVPEWAFHAGQNDVQIYSVRATDRRLVPCIVSDRPK